MRFHPVDHRYDILRHLCTKRPTQIIWAKRPTQIIWTHLKKITNKSQIEPNDRTHLKPHWARKKKHKKRQLKYHIIESLWHQPKLNCFKRQQKIQFARIIWQLWQKKVFFSSSSGLSLKQVSLDSIANLSRLSKNFFEMSNYVGKVIGWRGWGRQVGSSVLLLPSDTPAKSLTCEG